MSYEVTVLMPIYNAERYLSDSINSLLSQTCNNWKLICIDDGSTDSSKQIVESYCKKDNRITLICQKNAGPAVARAQAIELADTEYVSILDSDDAYSPNYIELMLKRAEETKADIIVPDVEFGYGNTTKLPNMFIQHNLSPDLIINNGLDAFSMTFPWKLHGWQMIKTKLAKKYYTIEEASYSKFNSDEYITRLLYLKSTKIALCSALYKYRIDPHSITRTNSLKKLDYLTTLSKLLQLSIQEKVPTHILINIYNDFYSTIISMLKMAYTFHDTNREIALKSIEHSYSECYLPNLRYKIIKQANLKTKIKFIMSKLGLFTFKIQVICLDI